MRFCFFGDNGRIDSAHNDDTVVELPEGAVELSDDQWDIRFDLRLQNGVLVVDPIVVPVEQLKESAWIRIKAKRDAIKAGGVKVGTKWYHTDTESRIQHLGLLEKARSARAAAGTDATRLQVLGQDIKWKTMDGSFIYLTVKHAEDIFAAVTDLDAAAFAAAEMHRVAMEASADPAAYDFSAGWPATFAG